MPPICAVEPVYGQILQEWAGPVDVLTLEGTIGNHLCVETTITRVIDVLY